MQQMTANLTSKANPNTGMSGGDMMAYYRQAMADAMEEEAAAYERQIESQVRALNAQKDPLEQQYNKSAQQAYIQSELAKKKLPEQLAAQGLGGGASESANLAIETNYGNALNDLTQDYNNNLAALDLQMQQLRANGEIAKAQALAQYKQQMAGAYLQQAQRQQELQDQMALYSYQNQLKNQSYSGGGENEEVDFGEEPKPYLGNPDFDYSKPGRADSVVPIINANMKRPISAAKSEMLQRWYQANPTENFMQLVKDAIERGGLTQAEYQAWANGR